MEQRSDDRILKGMMKIRERDLEKGKERNICETDDERNYYK